MRTAHATPRDVATHLPILLIIYLHIYPTSVACPCRQPSRPQSSYTHILRVLCICVLCALCALCPLRHSTACRVLQSTTTEYDLCVSRGFFLLRVLLLVPEKGSLLTSATSRGRRARTRLSTRLNLGWLLRILPSPARFPLPVSSSEDLTPTPCSPRRPRTDIRDRHPTPDTLTCWPSKRGDASGVAPRHVLMYDARCADVLLLSKAK